MRRTALEFIGAVSLSVAAATIAIAAGGSGADPDRRQAQSVIARPPLCTAAPAIETLLADSADAYAARNAVKGISLLQRAFHTANAQGCVVERAEALRRLAIADAFTLKFEAALEKLQEALPVFRQYSMRPPEAQTLAQIGFAFYSRGMREQATKALLEARAIALDLRDARLLLLIYDNLVYSMPPGPEKDRVRVEALDYVRRTPGGRPVECNVLHQWGDELFSSDRYAPALARITEATACFEEVGDASRLGRAYVSLGRVYRAHGRLDLALEQYVRAVILQQKVGDRLAETQSLNAIGVTLGAMGRYEESLERLTESLGLATRIGSERFINLITANIAGQELAMRHYQRAATMLEEALAHPNADSRPERLGQLARAYLGLRDTARALPIADRAVALATKGEARDRITALSSRAQVLAALKRFDAASEDLRVAVDTVEGIRANTLRDDYLTRGFGDLYQWLFSTTISLLEMQGRSREALEVAERARARAFLDLLAAHDRRAAVAGSAKAIGPDRGEAATFSQAVAAAARLHSTLLIYWVGETETFVWVVREDGGVTTARIDAAANELAAMVRSATGNAGASTPGLLLGSGSTARQWRALYRLLLQPIRHQLPDRPGSRITIVPHGPLFGLPFAALRDQSGKYLIESYNVHYIPAIGALKYTSTPSTGGETSALLVGDPGPDASRDRAVPLPSLPWANREVKAVSQLLGGQAVTVTGQEATEAGVRALLPGKTLLHFATHGIVQNEERLSSYLALRPTSTDDDDAAADGRLTANEAYGLHLDADLIVLSGCRTALGPIMGDGVIGFTRAFLAAGASSVVATMWDVPDRTSFEVMRSFYAARKRGVPKSEALRAAQLSVLRSLRAGRIRVDGVRLPESPALWAGYVLVGQP